ncbi:MAG TPA: Na/Pi symporter [Methylovirgula sp.]|jgi:phosphate:Na+ symporter
MLSLDVFASLLAGLGLLYIGIKGIAANLSQLAGRGLRVWIALSTGSYVTRALVGTLAGALTQSTSAVTVILMSLATADLITISQAVPLLVWANVGTSALVLAVAVNIHLFVLFLTAVVGVCYYLNLDRSPRWRLLVATLFSVSLLFLGLEFVRIGTDRISEVPWIRDSLLLAGHWNATAFAIGILLAFVVQSSSTVAVILTAMASAGLLTLAQSMMIIFGASAGSGWSTYLMARGISGSSRRLPIMQAVVKVLGIAILVPLFIVEQMFHLHLLQYWIREISSDPSRQVAYVYLACQLTSVIAEILFSRVIPPILERVAPPSHDEAVAKPHYLYPQALSEPESALALVDREQERVFHFLPLHLGVADHLDPDEARPKPWALLDAATSLDAAIGRFLADLADSGPSRELLDKIANRQARNNLLLSLHESLAELARVIAVPFETSGMASLSANITEGLAGLLMVAADAVRSDDPDELALLRKLTADRDSLVDQLRRRVIAADKELSVRDQHRLYTVTNLFERVVWMLRRYGNLLAVDADSLKPVEAGSSLETSTATLS